ncbi:MAG: type II toxin-antitoxin system RelE/ParE family toxin [Bacteroidetes bacterium]|nr:MAG: type II toxin-antitoxin system RelE/ParE family toxin [Bacteroidota bacterium]
MKYKISKEASRDIENIWLYTIEKWSIEQADRYFNLIMDEIEYLANNPKSGEDYSKVRKGYFRSQIKSHFIFYKISIKNKEIEIIRILHQRMDIEVRLNE